MICEACELSYSIPIRISLWGGTDAIVLALFLVFDIGRRIGVISKAI